MSAEVAVWGWLDPGSSGLKPTFKQAKNMVQCENEKNTRQPPDVATAEGRDKNEFKTYFFSSTVQKKRNQNIYLHTVVCSGVTLSTVGKNMQIPLHSDENIPSFFTYKAAHVRMRKKSV